MGYRVGWGPGTTVGWDQRTTVGLGWVGVGCGAVGCFFLSYAYGGFKQQQQQQKISKMTMR